MDKLHLTAFGYEYTPAHQIPDKREVKKVMEILKDCKKEKFINRKASSYTLKHLIESYLSTYISNGAFILAATNLGFTANVNPPNASFNIPQSFLRKLKKSTK